MLKKLVVRFVGAGIAVAGLLPMASGVAAADSISMTGPGSYNNISSYGQSYGRGGNYGGGYGNGYGNNNKRCNDYGGGQNQYWDGSYGGQYNKNKSCKKHSYMPYWLSSYGSKNRRCNFDGYNQSHGNNYSYFNSSYMASYKMNQGRGYSYSW